jgi:hypothetical protein
MSIITAKYTRSDMVANNSMSINELKKLLVRIAKTYIISAAINCL